MSTIVTIEFPHSKIFDKIISFYDLNSTFNLEHIFKAVYIIYKNLLTEIKKNKPNFSHFFQESFNQNSSVFKYFLDLSSDRIKEFNILVENSDNIENIDKINLYMNENLLKFALKMLMIEISMNQTPIPFEAEKYIANMEFLQKLGKIKFFFI